MKKSEFDKCQANGVKDIIEIQIGYDGLAFGQSTKGPEMALTLEDVYKALAANPYGKPNTAKTWQDVSRRSDEHTSELQSLMRTSYAVFCLKKKKPNHSL